MRNENLPYGVNPDRVYAQKYIEMLNKFCSYKSNEKRLICSYPLAGYKYESELLVIGREASWWPERFTIHELNVKGAEYIYHTKARLPGAYAVRKVCPMNFVPDLWGDTKERRFYNTRYRTDSDPFWYCAKEVVEGLNICQDKKEWASYLSFTNLYKVVYGAHQRLYEKPRLMQLELCKELLKLEIYMGQPKRILFLTGMKFAKDFLNLPEGIGMDGNIVSLGKFDYGVHMADTVVSVNPRKFKKEELVSAILKGFARSAEVGNSEWSEYRACELADAHAGRRMFCSKFIGGNIGID